MSDVRFNKPALPFALGLALAMTIAGTFEPAEAASGLQQFENGASTAAADTGLVQLADNSDPDGAAAQDEPAPETASEPAPDSAAEPASESRLDQSQESAPQTAAPAAPPAMPDGTFQSVGATAAAPEPALPESRPDYYTERAKKTVEQDGKEDGKPHPLQAAHPDQNVVVCEGGCPSEKSAQIVFIEPRAARKPIAEGKMIPSSSDASAKAVANSVVTCEAGCYDAMPRSYTGIPGGVASGIPMAAMAGASDASSWVTTVTPEAASAGATPVKLATTKPQTQGGSGEWMNRISNETGQSAKAPAQLAAAAKGDVASTVTAPAPQGVAQVQSAAEKATATKPSVETTVASPVAVSPAPAAQDAKVAQAAQVAMTEVKPATPEAAIKVEPLNATTEVHKPVAPALDVAKADAAKTPIAAVVATPGQASPAAAVANTGPAKDEDAAKEMISAAPKPSDAAVAAPSVAPPAVTTPAVTPSILNEKASAEPAAAVITPVGLAKSEAPVTASGDKPAHDTKPDAAADVQTPAVATPASGQAPVIAEAKLSVVAKVPEAPTAEAPAPEIKAPEVKSTEVAVEKPAPMQVAELTKPESAAPEAKPAPVAGKSHDPVVNIETADAEMAAAMATARANLPEFWSKLEQPAANESDFSLKVAIQGRNAKEVEHFWLTNIVRKDGKITGTISNDPSSVKTVRRGQTYAVNPDKISDWLYKRNGKMVGNETMRPLLKRLPAQQAASYREMYEKP